MRRKKNVVSEKTEQLRPATSHLAIVAGEAVRNASGLCENVSTIEELRKIVESFDGCTINASPSLKLNNFIKVVN